jgi:hypothetical protein
VSQALMPGTLPGGGRNGLPAWPPYVYRGKLTLEAELPYECSAGCGRRVGKESVCATCRGCYGDAPKRPWGRAAHGTEAMYRKHLRNGEQACAACIEGARQAHRERNARRLAPSEKAINKP